MVMPLTVDDPSKSSPKRTMLDSLLPKSELYLEMVELLTDI